ncbi:SDA1-domain-containing protein, partial [Rozella allomycis CSF55]
WEIEEDEEESEGEWIDMPQDEDIKFDDEEDAEMTEEMIQEEKDLKTKTAEFLQTKILTPQDFAKMKQTEEQDLAERMAGVKKSKKRSADAMNENDELVNVKDIEGYQKRAKQTYEERMESIKAGREGREKFGSRKGKKDKECSSTNREKQKKKNFLMVAHKKEIKGKSKLKLRDKQ